LECGKSNEPATQREGEYQFFISAPRAHNQNMPNIDRKIRIKSKTLENLSHDLFNKSIEHIFYYEGKNTSADFDNTKIKLN